MRMKRPAYEDIEALARGVPRYLDDPCLQKFQSQRLDFFFAPELHVQQRNRSFTLSERVDLP